jgi:nucleoside-diphosphate-sugar epimerase
MRVFVTGASGHIGTAIVPELLNAGHEVVGLARSDASAAALEGAGAEVRRGDLDDIDGLALAAAAADGVIHLAFKHDWMRSGDFAGAVAADLAAVQAMGAALEASAKPFLTTSGTAMLALGGITGRPGTEHDVIEGLPRVDSENYVIGLAGSGVRSAVLRLPPTVHSDLDLHGFLPGLIETARERGVSGYVGEGANRWPAVHTRDAARVYRLALERGPAGTRLHPVAEEGVQFREIAAAIAAKLELPVVSLAPEQAGEHFGFLAPFVSLDNPTSSAITRRLLAWEPAHASLLDDLAGDHYFSPAAV